jgi:hypothetical protein
VNRHRETRFHVTAAALEVLSMACRSDRTALFAHARNAHFAGVSAIARRSAAWTADASTVDRSNLRDDRRKRLAIARFAPWCIRFLNAEAVFFFLL